jgi:hypothetical protein
MLKVLIIGGYGTFGGRLAQLLAGDRRVDLVLAGRSLAKAQACCNRLGGAAVPAVFDRDGDVERQLRAIAPAVVVDATGPFQLYGHDPYRVVKAALAAGIHYLDLADDPAFVEGIAQFDAQARDRSLFVLAGVSSFPVLTAAVVRTLSHDMVRVLDVTCGIAPSPYANVGLNVIRAIASYAGKPVLGVAGRTIGHALIDTRRFTIAPPGAVPLVPIRFSLVDVPDLRVLPALWPELRAVWTGAGPVPEIWHRLLSALAWLVRLGLLHSLAPLAPLINRAKSALSWGEHRGGMLVAVGGVDADGRRIERSWHLLAEGEDGPIIPSMAAAAIVHRCRSGHPPAPGARNAAAEVELHDYEPWLAGRRITTGRRQDQPSARGAPLYRRLLGDAWERLPNAVAAMHDLSIEHVASGTATIERGTSLLARWGAALIGFPPAGRAVAVTVSFQARATGELWRRSFAGRSFASFQQEGRGDQLLWEWFGPLGIGMALVVEADRLRLVLRRWSLFGIVLPRAWAPRLDAYECEQDGRFHFHVDIRHPCTGLIIRYQGWMLRQV